MGKQVKKIQKGPPGGLRPGAPTKPMLAVPVKHPGTASAFPPGPKSVPKTGPGKPPKTP
jgi:hypothetical protein